MATRPTLKQFRDRDLSLWQSAVDEAVAEKQLTQRLQAGIAASVRRPDLADEQISLAASVAEAVSHGDILTGIPIDPESPAAGVADVAKFCAATAYRLAKARVKAIFTGDSSDLKKFEEEIGSKFGTCDPRWSECIEAYVRFKTSGASIPYRAPTADGASFIDERLPSNAKVAIVGDWGTGEDAARSVLTCIAARKPDVVFHLGDIYYSGTDHEVRNYFYAIWQSVLGIPLVQWGKTLPAAQRKATPITFSLSGNHDMYAGGQPYYTLIDMLGQPASCFCVRNSAWQFIALDTGLNDSRPGVETVTCLDPRETAWLTARVTDRGQRKTFLLSHHQLYSAFEKFAGGNLNRALYAQVSSILPAVTAWFWGHEHDLIVYNKFPISGNSVLGRCVGHGAFPVGVDEDRKKDETVPFNAKAVLSPDQAGGLFQHGYVVIQLNDAAKTATVEYYQVDGGSGRERLLLTEQL